MATRSIPGGFPSKTLIDGQAIERLRPKTMVEVYRFGIGEVDYARCPVIEVLESSGRAERCMRFKLEGGGELVTSSQQYVWVDGVGHVRAEGIDQGDLFRIRHLPKGYIWPLEEVVGVEIFLLPRARRLYLPVIDTSTLVETKGETPVVGVFANGILARIN